MGHLFNLESPLSQFLSRIIDIFILNVLFILFCIPIFTIGASTTALYSVLMKMIKNEDKNIIMSFFISFKRNFIKGTALWLIMVIAGAFIFLDFLLLGSLNGILRFMFTGMVFIFGFIYLCILFLVFPYTARYEDTIKKSILNSLLMGISNFPYLLAIWLLNGLFFFTIISSNIGFISGLYFGTFGGFALLGYLNTHLFSKVFKKYEICN